MSELTKIIDHAYACIDDDEEWAGLVERLCKTLDCEAASFFTFDSRSDQLKQTHLIGRDQGWLDEYDKWHFLNPLPSAGIAYYARKTRQERTVAARADQWLGYEGFKKSGIYNEFYRKSGISDYIGIPVDLTNLSTPLGINLWCRSAKGRFSARQFRLAQLTSPHIARAKSISGQLRYAKVYNQYSDLSLVHAAAFIVDAHMELLDYNPEARRLISKGRVRIDRNGKLRLINEGAAVRLQKSMRSLSKQRNVGEKTFKTGCVDISSELQATVTTLNGPSRAGDALRARNEYLLIITPRPQVARNLLDQIASLYGFTNAELEVASMLVAGCSLQRISETRSTKISTTRWHVKHLYNKIGVNNQRDFIRRLFAFAIEGNRAL